MHFTSLSLVYCSQEPWEVGTVIDAPVEETEAQVGSGTCSSFLGRKVVELRLADKKLLLLYTEGIFKAVWPYRVVI